METVEPTLQPQSMSPDEARVEIARWQDALTGLDALEQTISAELPRMKRERVDALGRADKASARELSDGISRLERELASLPEMREEAAAKLAEAKASRKSLAVQAMLDMLTKLQEERSQAIATALRTHEHADLVSAYVAHRLTHGLGHDLVSVGGDRRLGEIWSLGVFGFDLERQAFAIHTQYKLGQQKITKPWQDLLAIAREQ